MGEAKASGNLGNTLKVMGKFEEAVICCRRHLEICRSRLLLCYLQYCGSGMFIPDPGSEFFPSLIRIFHPRSGIHFKEFKYFNQNKIVSKLSEYDPGCSSRIRILIFLPIPDPGIKKAPDPQHWLPLKGTALPLVLWIRIRWIRNKMASRILVLTFYQRF